MLKSEDYLTIFHEIKNSITLIGSSLQLVEKKHPEVSNFDYWNEAMGEISFLKNMVSELSSSRICGKLNLTSVSMDTFIKEIVDSIRSLSWNHFFCEVSVDPDLPSVQIDPGRMKQAIINLLKNAYEAMHESGTVHLRVFQKQKQLYISVIDTGGGIDPACAKQIFDPFVTTKEGGSGLGLLITKQIVEAHQGSLTYESRPNDGCTFSIQLPLTQN